MQDLDLVKEVYDMIFSDGLLILIACYVLGNIITRCIPKINNNFTVLILTLTGGVLMVAIPTIYSDDPLTVRVIKGIILGWSSTGLHELLKGLSKAGYIKIPGYKLADNTETQEEETTDGVG